MREVMFPLPSILAAKIIRSQLNWRVQSVLFPPGRGKRLDPINLPISSNVIGCSHLVRRRRDASQRPGLCRYPHQEPRGLGGLRHQPSRHATGRQEPRHAGAAHGRPQAARHHPHRRRRGPVVLRLGGCRRGGARCACGTSGKQRRENRARLPRAGGRAPGQGFDRVRRPDRQPARSLPWRRDRDRSVQARPFDLRLPHRSARHGPRRAHRGAARGCVAVLYRDSQLQADRLHSKTLQGVLLPHQSAPPQLSLHRHRQERHPSSDVRGLLSRRRRPGLRSVAAQAGIDRHHARPSRQRPRHLVLFVVAVEISGRIRLFSWRVWVKILQKT